MNRFDKQFATHNGPLLRDSMLSLQINVGRKCNQACRHCHVDAAPWRTESLNHETASRICEWIKAHRPQTVDITGGAPELNDNFREIVKTAHNSGCETIDRCNLTILLEKGFEWVPTFLTSHEVVIIASLPCYRPENVNRQRGNGVFNQSIRALQKLNSLGYGTTIPLHLVHNPIGASLPPPQSKLEADYKKSLKKEFGILFNQLFTITNQPIARFSENLRELGKYDEYMELLAASFNQNSVQNLMCRSTLNVGIQGELYDCDFNQMLGMHLGEGKPIKLWDITPDLLDSQKIQTGDHCLACSAGDGSSCTGALALDPYILE